MPHFPDSIYYSDKYFDDDYEYRHVFLTEALFKKMPKDKYLTEQEWRDLGV